MEPVGKRLHLCFLALRLGIVTPIVGVNGD